jgi:hypothetical protein
VGHYARGSGQVGLGPGTCYPYAANSRWFEDVAGREIAAAAEVLSPEAVTEAQERGRSRDLWATVEELLDELAPEEG